MKNKLIEVDMNLIRELRHNKNSYEATELLNAYQDNLKKSRNQDKKELQNIENKKWRLINKDRWDKCINKSRLKYRNRNICLSWETKCFDKHHKTISTYVYEDGSVEIRI